MVTLTKDDLYWAAAELLKEQAAEPTYRIPAPTFRDFIREAWTLLEPVSTFEEGWHIDAIADHLTAITEGQLRNLIINVPPRSGKSSLVSVLWPAWVWIAHPEKRWLFASYAASLSVRDSVKCRRVIESDWYQERWGDRYRLVSDQNTKASYENDRTGLRLATSVGGQGTGQGGDVLVVDDATSAEQAESEASRVGANEWYDGTMSTRGNNPATVARVVIQQRLHEQDLTGHILATMAEGGEQYDHLILPAAYEPRVQVCLSAEPIQHDPRTEADEPLWSRFSADILAPLKVSLGDRAAGQLQQRPAPAGGAIFKREWWADGKARYDPAIIPSEAGHLCVARYLSYDTAMKKGRQNDYTALVVLELLSDWRIRVRSIRTQRLEFHELVDTMKRDAVLWNADGKLREILIEDKGSGTSAGQTVRAGTDPELAAMIAMFEPQGDKEYRARSATQWCALGLVLLPDPHESVPWLADFAGPEPGGALFKFPTVAHDDEIDALVQGILYLENYLAEALRARGGVAA
jgi:predicted phage terminase large subunit-like protein